MSEFKDNVRSIVGEINQRNAKATVDVALTDEFYSFLFDESERRFESIEEQRQIQINHLYYALGLAIGALEAVSLTPSGCRQEAIEDVLSRLKAITELQFYSMVKV